MPPRHFAPSGRVTFYRFTASLPLEVVFPSVTYLLAVSEPVSGRNELLAKDARDGGRWRIGPEYRSPDLLLEALQVAGVPVQADTAGGTIMRRLVLEGRAVVVAASADDPAERWPEAARPLYDGEDSRAIFLANRDGGGRSV